MVRSSCIFERTVMKIGTDKDNYMQQVPCKFILGRNQALGYTPVFPGSCNTILMQETEHLSRKQCFVLCFDTGVISRNHKTFNGKLQSIHL